MKRHHDGRRKRGTKEHDLASSSASQGFSDRDARFNSALWTRVPGYPGTRVAQTVQPRNLDFRWRISFFPLPGVLIGILNKSGTVSFLRIRGHETLP
eukprot:2416878-Rhodomonas_salina.1